MESFLYAYKLPTWQSITNGTTSHDLESDKKLSDCKKKKPTCRAPCDISEMRSGKTVIVKHNLARKKRKSKR